LRDYIKAMTKHTAPKSLSLKPLTLAFLLLSGGAAVFSAGAAWAQALPEDPALQRAQAQAQVNQTLQQTQQNNYQMQFQLQQNELRQQQLFNTMPPPAFQQPAYQPYIPQQK
jgi:hypothetical protein